MDGIFDSLMGLNEYMVHGDVNVKFTLGIPSVTPECMSLVPIITKYKLDSIYAKLNGNDNFKYSCINKKVSGTTVLSDDLKLYTETENILYDTVCFIPGWTHSFKAVAYTLDVRPARNYFEDSTSVQYHCDRFEYKNVWHFDLITMTRIDKAEIYMFELVFNGDKAIASPRPAGYYIQSAVAKLLDFNEQI
jgi:hypothetical protein